MNVLMLNPPFKEKFGKFSREQRSPAVTKSGTFYYPMWLAYAAGVLDEAGYNTLLLDAPAKRVSKAKIYEGIKAFKPDLIVIDTSTPSISNDVEVAEELKDMTGAFIILVGTHPSALPEETLKMSGKIDAVAIHEYEMTIKELADYLKAVEMKWDDSGLRKIKGIAYQNDGNIVINPDRELITDLDSLPFISKVYKKYLDYKDYFYAHSKYPIITLLAGRGCPYQCVYCVYPQTFSGHKLRFRSVKNVVDEIEYVLREFPDVKEIMFEDDTLTVNREHVRAFSEEIIRRGLKFEWSANSRADVDLDTMKIMRKAGARLFCVGVESGEQKVLDTMKKSMQVTQISKFFKDAKTAGIKIHGCFLLGLPGETKETLKTTLNFALQLNPDTAQFFPIMVYPGTEAYNWARENDYLVTNDFNKWLTYDGLHNTVVSRPGLSNDELVSFCDFARKKYYIRLRYLVWKFLEGLTDFNEMKRLFKGAWQLRKYLFKSSVKEK